MFIEDRNAARQVFIQAWRKHRERLPLEPLEALVADVVEMHPEYHALLASVEEGLDKDFTPDAGVSNPFLHMGMHIALREQVGTNHPPGIAPLFVQALSRCGDAHALEHEMMECLGEILWNAQRGDRLPDEVAYLNCLKQRLSR